MENGSLEQSLQKLEQPEPSAQLDVNILDGIKQLLTLENYQKSESLLLNEGDRLDQATRVRLASGMVNIREQFGPGFQEAYQSYQARQADQQPAPQQDDLQA